MFNCKAEHFEYSHFDCTILQASFGLSNEVRWPCIQTTRLANILLDQEQPYKRIFLGSQCPYFGQLEFQYFTHDIEGGL